MVQSHVHKVLHLLPLHAGLQLTLLRLGQPERQHHVSRLLFLQLQDRSRDLPIHGCDANSLIGDGRTLSTAGRRDRRGECRW